MPAPARVLYVVHALGACGATDLVRQLAGELDRERFAPEVLALRAEDGGATEASGDDVEGAERFREAGIPAHRLALPARGSVRARVAPVARFLARERVAVVHAQTRPGDLWTTWAGWAARTPARVYSRQATYGGMTRATRARYALTARAASGVVAVSDAVASHLERVEHVPRERITRIPDGVDFAAVDRAPGRSEARRRIGLDPSAPVFTCVASLVPRKGVEDLVRAFVRVRRQRRDARLLVVGDGERRAAIEAQLHAEALGDAVMLLGWQDDPLPAVAASDAFVLASHWEGLNLSLITAAGMGRPIVATRLRSNEEIVEHGVSGWLPSPATAALDVSGIDPEAFADAMLELAARPDRGEAMGRAGRARVRARFGADAMARAHERLYERLLAGRRAIGAPPL